MKDKRSMSCELIDIASIDRDNLLELSMCENKPEVVFQWLQNEVVDSVKSGVLSIPPPLLTRSFQEMGAAMKQYHRSTPQWFCVDLDRKGGVLWRLSPAV